MLLDRTHQKWAWTSFLIFLASLGIYIVYANSAANGPHGGSVIGLIFGIIGTVMMVFAGLLAARKRLPHKKLGSAQFWLRGHLWLGTLSVPMILFHAGFGWGGLVENILWITFGIVVVSGFVGLALQQVLPRIMTTRVPYETFQGQVPYQCRRMQLVSDKLVAEIGGPLNITSDELYQECKKVAEFAATASKDDLGDWPDKIDQSLRGLFVDLAKFSKNNGWINKEDNFPKMFAEIYTGIEGAKKNGAAKKAGGKKASPLDQMKAKAGGAKKMSPLEQMKAKAAGGGEKKLSPLEQMKAKAAAGKGAAAKKLSPIEQMRAKAAQKSDGGAPAKKKSPLELAREQAGKKAGGGDAPAKKKSLLELAREQAAGAPAPISDVDKAAQATLNFTAEEFASLQSKMDADPELNRESVPVPCPECDHILQIPDRSMLGRKARCPMCTFKFILEDPDEEVLVAAKAQWVPQEEADAEPEPVAAPGKKLSPIEQMRAKAAAKKAPADSGKKLSPLEQMKAKAAAGKGAAKKGGSPLEQMRAKAGKPAAAKKPAKKQAALKVKAKKKKKKSGPIPRADELRDFYVDRIRPFLDVDSRPRNFRTLSVDIQSKRLFAQMRGELPGELHETLNQLEEFVDERRQFITQSRIHKSMHYWLIFHIPVSMALYVFMVMHIIVSLRVVPL